MAEGHVEHELLLTVLLILGSTGVRRAVGTHNHNNILSSAIGFRTQLLGHGVLLDKAQKSHFIEVLCVWSCCVVV